MEHKDLIPGLPDDIALQCLIKLPYDFHSHIRRVCRTWGSLITSADFYSYRRRAKAAASHICMVQDLPSTGQKACPPATGLGLSICNLGQSSWRWLPKVPDFPHGLPLFCQCVAMEDRILLIGGWNPCTYEAMKSVYIFELSTQSWRRGSDMAIARTFFACAALNGQVFVAGGHDDDKNALSSAEVYSVADDQWQMLPSLNLERDECKGAILDGKFCVISGYSTDSQGRFVSSGEILDLAANRWVFVENIWIEGICPSALVYSGDGNVYACQKQEILKFCLKNRIWKPVATMPESKRVCACACLDSGNLFLVGSSGDGKGGCSAYILNTNSSKKDADQWIKLSSAEEFSGMIQAACHIFI